LYLFSINGRREKKLSRWRKKRVQDVAANREATPQFFDIEKTEMFKTG
jgi:hypothetical protein